MPTKTIRRLALQATAVTFIAAAPAGAAILYDANLQPLNGVGNGAAALTLDGNMLTVNIAASGLDDGEHLAHIHGRFTPSGDPMNSVLPDISADTDGDGFIELAEALPDYGPIILNMMAIGTGTDISFTQTFDLTDSANFGFVDGDSSLGKYTMEDLIGSGGMQLDLREIIVHGQFADAVGAGTDGEVDGTAGYKAVLPTLGGEIRLSAGAVPEPATWALMIGGFGLAGGMMRRKANSVSLA